MNKLQVTIFIAIILIFAIVLVITQSATLGLDEKEDQQIDLSQIPADITLMPSQNQQQSQSQLQTPQESPLQTFNQQELEQYKTASATATITTSKGTITLELYGEDAPLTVANFIKKAQEGFYEGLNFHRVEDWVVQGGDPSGDGTGGGNMPVEFNNRPFEVGSVGVASRGDGQVQNDAQFFITKKDSSFLNGQYTNFGKVTEGMDVVNQIEIGDTITGIIIQ